MHGWGQAWGAGGPASLPPARDPPGSAVGGDPPGWGFCSSSSCCSKSRLTSALTPASGPTLSHPHLNFLPGPKNLCERSVSSCLGVSFPGGWGPTGSEEKGVRREAGLFGGRARTLARS